ncbi:MAG: DNA-binding protein [Candidatus Bipolaricaulis sibiricus]|uniref:DNA-binding protein n=1 Tax=Bipolaricaulis sibiricus TaxID=2501609 RepID=A0A410FTR2_BIPS1|nr:MAG: DNA-binding protein [Candidatus Bipolaricaulis sibiricus]
MSASRRPPDDPREWLRRAKSSLLKAQKGSDIPGICLEDLCYDAQQAAEKALKALLIYLNKPFPYVHDLAVLIARLEEAGLKVPDRIKLAAGLTDYAVEARYPGAFEPVTQDEYKEAVELAEEVLRWAKTVVRAP